MYKVNMASSGHHFDKQNLVTVINRKRGGYDTYKCKNCGIMGRSYRLGIIEIPENYGKDKAHHCPMKAEFVAPKKIRIIHCEAFGAQFRNLTDGSEHEVVPAPGSYANDITGVWVMGVGEKVKVLRREYEVIT